MEYNWLQLVMFARVKKGEGNPDTLTQWKNLLVLMVLIRFARLEQGSLYRSNKAHINNHIVI